MNEIKIYSKNPCPYCVRAKNLLQDLGLKYTEIDMTNKIDELQELKNKTGHKTVPQIFIGQTFVGGFTELQALHDSGQLMPMYSGSPAKK